ncbi:acyl-CoA dehydrogenase [Chloroflexia bacterium SDU3-3]|nr:acyl-CoA dehydrogenase [Chloroflexia bacterium SDU3-3]
MSSTDLFRLMQKIDLGKIAKLAQQVDLGELMEALDHVDPKTLKQLLKRSNGAARREPPPIDADFYDIGAALSAEDREAMRAVAAFMEREVRPIAVEYWDRGEFPRQIIPAFAQMVGQVIGDRPFIFPETNPLFAGMFTMQLARAEPSIATFFGVHFGLSMGSINAFGSAEQKQRWMPAMRRFEKIGSWALTEPDVGSATSAGLQTTARREGDTWVINGAKKWSGNATFADVNVIMARDTADGQVKGFLVERGTPGYTVEKLQGKISQRMVENVLITLDNVQVDESSRLPGIASFRDIARQLASARSIVGWQATGLAMGAYERALAYAQSREQFGKSIGSFQLVQNMLVQMLGSVTAMQAMMLQLARLEERDGEISHERASLAKAFCGERMREVVALGRGLFGGNGILLEYEAAKYFADAEAIYSYEGTHEMNTLIVGRAITGVSAFV